MDIVLAVVLFLLTAATAYLGVHVTLHPEVVATRQQKRTYKIIFCVLTAFAAGLIATQSYISRRTQNDLKAQLDSIQRNTEKPPTVTVQVPPPQVVFPPQPKEQPRKAPKAQEEHSLPSLNWTQEQTEDQDGHPTVTVSFIVNGNLQLPGFLAICDRPCKEVMAQAGVMSHRIDLNWPGQDKYAGVFFDMPKPMSAGTPVNLRIVSLDNTPVKISQLQILQEKDIPFELR